MFMEISNEAFHTYLVKIGKHMIVQKLRNL